MSDEKNDPELAMVQAHVDALSEHFDTVQVFCSRAANDGEGGTIRINLGSGNWFARYGQTGYWLEQVKEEARLRVRDREQN